MGTISAAILMFLGLIAFSNYRNNSLPDWLKSKFLNASDPIEGAGLFEVDANPAAGTGPSLQMTGLGGALGRLLAPITGKITGTFGENRGSHNHQGIDWAAPIGTPVTAARGGVVTYAGSSGTYGMRIDVDHGGGVVTRYAHLNRVGVKVGQEVGPGARIGESGNTGRSTGPHLHFEVLQGGKATDPAKLLGVSA